MGRAEDDFAAAVRRFSEHRLPAHGWSRVLEVGAGTHAQLLEERGYRVTVANALGAEPKGEYDVALCFDPAPLGGDPVRAAAALRPRLRTDGLLFAGPAFAASARAIARQGFAPVGEYEAPVFRARGRLGRFLAGLSGR